jgi:hypothetical protein
MTLLSAAMTIDAPGLTFPVMIPEPQPETIKQPAPELGIDEGADNKKQDSGQYKPGYHGSPEGIQGILHRKAPFRSGQTIPPVIPVYPETDWQTYGRFLA